MKSQCTCTIIRQKKDLASLVSEKQKLLLEWPAYPKNPFFPFFLRTKGGGSKHHLPRWSLGFTINKTLYNVDILRSPPTAQRERKREKNPAMISRFSQERADSVWPPLRFNTQLTLPSSCVCTRQS